MKARLSVTDNVQISQLCTVGQKIFKNFKDINHRCPRRTQVNPVDSKLCFLYVIFYKKKNVKELLSEMKLYQILSFLLRTHNFDIIFWFFGEVYLRIPNGYHLVK